MPNWKKLITSGSAASLSSITTSGDITIPATNKIYLDGGGNTYITEEVADQITLRAGGGNYFKVGTTNGIIINDPGADLDTRIEGNTDQNLLFVDAGEDRVGVGTNSPGYKLDVAGDARSDRLIFRTNTSAPTADAAVYRAADNTFAVSTNNNERMRIDSSGNVGIGETGPTHKLQVASAGSSDSVIRINADNARGASRYALDIVDDDTNGRGSVRISTTSGPSIISNADIQMAATSKLYLDGGSDTYIHEASAGIYELRVNNLDVMSADMNAGANVVFNDQQLDIDFRIESNNASHTFFVDAGQDRVGIGTNSPDSFVHISASVGSSTASLHVEGSGSEVFAVDGTNGRLFTVTDELSGSLFSANTIAGLPVIEAFSDYKVTLGPYSSQTTVDSSGNLSVSGEIRATGDVIAFYSSDERFKDNIQPIQDSLYKISKIGGYEYDWNDKQSTYEGHDVGVIAQEIQEVLPEVVTEREDGYLAVKYEKVVPLLIESIKELKQEVDDIKKNCKCLSDGNKL